MPIIHFKSQIYKIQISLLYNRFVCLMASRPTVRPSSTMARAPVFHTITVIVSDLRNHCSEKRLSIAPWSSFYPLLVSFCLQISYGKVINSLIGVNKLVG